MSKGVNNITRIWATPRRSRYSNLFTNNLSREYTYFFNIPREDVSDGLTLEEIHCETVEIEYDASDNRMASQCPISFDEFRDREPVLQIRRCGHIFKPDELRRWLTRHTGCPVCRCDLRIPHGDQQEETPDPGQDESDDVDYSDMPELEQLYNVE